VTILTYPDKRLRVKAEPVEKIDDEITALIDTMTNIMRDHEQSCLGLAATQIGVPKRVFVYAADASPQPRIIKALVNPEITTYGSVANATAVEGCLSIVGYAAEVLRPYSIKVEGLDGDGNTVAAPAYGLLARLIQHEVDHLDGILFIDRISQMKRDMYKRKLKKWMKKK
jgi:peptide deformylase